MKPENSAPLVGQEQLVMPPAPAGERIPVLPTPEAGIETGADRKEQTAEASAAVADATAQNAPTAGVVSPATVPIIDDNPLIAADEDVIEKEWVDKARKIIDETKDDPHARSARVSDLQKDYLKKRYGKVLGASVE